MSERRDYYEVLGVERGVDAAELKRAYRKLAMELHPDRNPGDDVSEAKFKEASEAYQVLSDPEKRARYDRFGHAGPGAGFGGGFHDVGDIFSAFADIFGDIFGGGRAAAAAAPRRAARTSRCALSMTLEEAFTGAEKDVKVLRRARCGKCGGTGAAAGTSPETCQHCGGRGQVMHSQGFLMISTTCPVCRGEGRVIRKPCGDCDGTGLEHQEETLQVNIPAGIEDGSTLRLVGRGEAAPQGGRAGNLYVILRVQPDERFERDGANLHTEVAVSFPQLALGDTVEVPTLDGEARDRDSAGDAAGRDGRAARPGDAAHRRAGPGGHRRAPEAGGAVVAVGGRGGAPARLRGVGRTARQPRARRLLQAQEEEIRGRVIARRTRRARARRGRRRGVIIWRHASLVLGAVRADRRGRSRVVGRSPQRRRRWWGGRGRRRGGTTAARPGRVAPPVRRGAGRHRDVRVRREVHDDGRRWAGGNARHGDADAAQPVSHGARDLSAPDADGCPAIRRCRIATIRRASTCGTSRRPSPMPTCRPRWRWRRRPSSATCAVADGPNFYFMRADGRGFNAGLDCDTPSATCKPIPPGVGALVELLRALIRQERMHLTCSAITGN